MRDVSNGWFLRYLHANGASVFFIAVYLHVFRGLYYGSYTTSPRESLWCIGVVLLIRASPTNYCNGPNRLNTPKKGHFITPYIPKALALAFGKPNVFVNVITS